MLANYLGVPLSERASSQVEAGTPLRVKKSALRCIGEDGERGEIVMPTRGHCASLHAEASSTLVEMSRKCEM